MELSEHSVKDAQWAFEYLRDQLEHKGVRKVDPSDCGAGEGPRLLVKPLELENGAMDE